MKQPPSQTVVAIAGDTIVGSAKMGTNRPGRGAHVATASFLVDPRPPKSRGGTTPRAVRARLGALGGFKSIQFNAVVEANEAAVHLWQSLGYDIVGTAPASFDHPEAGVVGLHLMNQHL